jgi:hypothetical protein
MERDIHALEKRQAELTEALQDSATYAESSRAMETQRDFQENQSKLRALNTRWEAAATRLSALDAG